VVAVPEAGKDWSPNPGTGRRARPRWPVLRPARYAWRCIAWPVAQHQVLALAYCGGHTQGEIAGLSGVPLSTLVRDDRHVIANMGVELGATTTVFPADEAVRAFLRGEGPVRGLHRSGCRLRRRLGPQRGHRPVYSGTLIARPSSPGKRGAGLGGGGKPGQRGRARLLGQSRVARLRDRAAMVAGRQPHDGVSFDVSPLFPGILCDLTRMGATCL
jgi:aconitate hydratase